MAETSFFADTLAVTFDVAGGATLDVGILKGVEIIAEWEHVELFGQDTVFREDVARKNVSVSVKASFSKFHPNILGKILGTENADLDIDGGASVGDTQAEIIDSNTVPLFDLQGDLTGKNAEDYIGKVTNVYFENAPFTAPDGEFVQVDLVGKGDKMYLQYVTT